MRQKTRMSWEVLLLSGLLALFFTLLYWQDNQYKTPPPYGQSGVIALTEAGFDREKPIFLISGWLLSDERVSQLPTYIGEYSNLQRGDPSVSPHGTALYQITLRYSGEPVEVSINFPQLFSRHRIWLDEEILAKGWGGAKVSFTLRPGDHVLSVETFSRQGFYSGIYHPPALAVTETLFSAVLIQCIAYGLLFFVPLALALYTLSLWRWGKDRLAFWFGLLCIAFALYVSYYFVRLLHLPFVRYWYLVQSVSLYALFFCVLQVMALAGKNANGKAVRMIRWTLVVLALLSLALALLIPVFPQAVRIHGRLTDLYYIVTFCALLFLMLWSEVRPGWESHFSLLGCGVFGFGLLLNLFASNLFEPIWFFWQFEWCGLFLVVLFGAMMAIRNQRILQENEALHNHLEELVEQRTAELHRLLQERKAFFSHMAHDLKAPIFATKAFIQAIRENDTGVDGELRRYIDLVEQKQQEMDRRVQGLSTFNRVDAIEEPKEPMSVQGILQEGYEAHHMAAEVASIYLDVFPPQEDGTVLLQPKKLDILLENLVYNALRATPAGGRISLSATLEKQRCCLTIADTGCGIPPEELPHIFERFFVGEQNQGVGSGLGLYLVKTIVTDAGGEITATSQLGQGTAFHITLPLVSPDDAVF